MDAFLVFGLVFGVICLVLISMISICMILKCNGIILEEGKGEKPFAITIRGAGAQYGSHNSGVNSYGPSGKKYEESSFDDDTVDYTDSESEYRDSQNESFDEETFDENEINDDEFAAKNE